MRKVLIAVLAAAMCAPAARAQQASVIQLSLLAPVQLVPETKPIRGVRLSLLYGRNISVDGFDWGLVNHNTGSGSSGLQIGAVNLNDGGYEGLSYGLVNVVRTGKFSGWMDGVVNMSDDFEGLQSGFINKANRASGLQFGLINIAKQMHGVQIGLINIINQGGVAPVLPIVNWSF